MKILIATGIYPPDIGGPAIYAFHLRREFEKLNHKVEVLAYGVEKRLPWGLRQFWYLGRIFFASFSQDFIIAFDTVSTGLPAVFVSLFLRKKVIVRIGGDFLWESYIERADLFVPLSEFYQIGLKLSFKEQIIKKLHQFLLDYSDAIVFSTAWQRDIWLAFYKLELGKVFVIENYYPPVIPAQTPGERRFLWAGRPIRLKNVEALEKVFKEIGKIDKEITLEVANCPRLELLKKIRNCYAVILPSVSEVSPNFIIEAISFGKPFILTKDTGLREKLEGLGIFVNPLDFGEIKSAVFSLCGKDKYEEFRKNIASFSYVHSWSDIASEFLSLLRKKYG